MSPEIIAAITAVVALIIAGFALYRARQPLSVENVTTTLQTSTNTAQELTEIALVAVQASEQLWRSGKIEKGERLDKAFAYVKRWFPDLDQATIVTALEASVLVVNALVDSIPKKPPAGDRP